MDGSSTARNRRTNQHLGYPIHCAASSRNGWDTTNPQFTALPTQEQRQLPAALEVVISTEQKKTLVLGLGNVILGDEGVGVHVVRALGQHNLPAGVECLDGGTGGFILLEPLQQAERIILIDATADGQPYGTVTRTTPKFAKDYPPTLTAHDIGVKDLLDAFYMQGGSRDVVLYTITIDPNQPISMDLSEPCAKAREEAVRQILAELRESCT